MGWWDEVVAGGVTRRGYTPIRRQTGPVVRALWAERIATIMAIIPSRI